MSGQETFLQALDADLVTGMVDAGLGDVGIYTPPGVSPTPIPDCHVLVDHGVQFFGDDPAGVVGTRTVVRLQLSEVPSPLRDATLAVGARTYLLDKKIGGEPGVFEAWVVFHG